MVRKHKGRGMAMDLTETVWFACVSFLPREKAGGRRRNLGSREPVSTYPSPPPKKQKRRTANNKTQENVKEKSHPLKCIKAPIARTSWDMGISIGLETPARHLRSGAHTSGEPWRGHPAGQVYPGTMLNSGQLCSLFLWGQGLRGWSNQWYNINRALSPTEQACPGSSGTHFMHLFPRGPGSVVKG